MNNLNSTVDRTNYFEKQTRVNFKEVVPADMPIFLSTLEERHEKVNSPSSDSVYFVSDKGVYRYSDHWGSIGDSTWNLVNAQGVVSNDSSSFRLGHAKFEDFEVIEVDKFHLGGDMSNHLAPNGQPSNLTHEQWHLVRTKAFKDWFGDWENDPENASKVVDENGEPLVVWHYSRSEKKFTEFKNVSNSGEIGIHFGNEEQAKKVVVSPNPIKFQCFLNMRNPLFTKDIQFWTGTDIADNILEPNNIPYNKSGKGLYSSKYLTKDDVFTSLKNQNIDGFIYDNLFEGKGLSYSVFYPTQIKLADGTNTTFDGNNPDIRYEQGGMTGSSSMLFWHGGNLEEFNDLIAQKNGRYEYGAGLYLTTELSVALKYSKGSRKLYLVEVERGNDIRDSYLDVNRMNEFISSYVAASKRKEINQRLAKHISNGQIKAYVFNTVILNEKAIKPSNTVYLREFLVKNGIDYEIVNNAFGWGEDMMILYNMDLIKNKKIVKQNDSYDIDLNTFKFEEGGVVTTSDYFKNTQGEFKGIEPKLAKAILDEYSKWRKKRNKPDFITVEGIGKLSVNYESEHSSGYFKSRSLSYYFTTEKGDLIRISDHWSKSNYPRSGKLNCGMIASCYWENYGERFDYRLPSQSYSSDLIAGIINPSKLIRMRNSEDYFEQGGLFHGSPYKFDKFKLSQIGTGEGAQAFGWGLYFTDVESIARNYANSISSAKSNSESIANYVYSGSYTKEQVNKIMKMSFKEQTDLINKAYKEKVEKIQLKKDSDFKKHLLETQDNLRDMLVSNIKTISPVLYKVTLHKGKTPDQYTWLEWDKPVPDSIYNTVGRKLKSNGKFLNELFQDSMEFEKTDGTKVRGKRPDGLLFYKRISQILGSDKEASLFLLENGIDGIKYPAESISRGATSDTARGFNYVVFDENAVTIEDVEQFAKGGMLPLSAFNKNLSSKIKEYDDENADLKTKRNRAKLIYAMEFYAKNGFTPLAEPDTSSHSLYDQLVTKNDTAYQISFMFNFEADSPKISKASAVLYTEDWEEVETFAKGGLIKPKKAKEILRHGKVYGKELTDKQRRFMYASANQKFQLGGISPKFKISDEVSFIGTGMKVYDAKITTIGGLLDDGTQIYSTSKGLVLESDLTPKIKSSKKVSTGSGYKAFKGLGGGNEYIVEFIDGETFSTYRASDSKEAKKMAIQDRLSRAKLFKPETKIDETVLAGKPITETQINDAIKVLSQKYSKPEIVVKALLIAGERIELEHTDNKGVATQIALNHLAEDIQYYSKLQKVESRK